MAAVPRRELDTAGRPLAVRCYFAISNRLPAFRSGLFGRGAIALTEEARARFDQFPEMIADDLYGDPETPVNDKTLPNKALKRTGQNSPPCRLALCSTFLTIIRFL